MAENIDVYDFYYTCSIITKKGRKGPTLFFLIEAHLLGFFIEVTYINLGRAAIFLIHK